MSMCSSGDSFYVNVLTTFDGLSFNGCYQDTGYTTSSLIRYSLDGVTIDAATGPDTPIIFADQEASSDHPIWHVGIERQDYGTARLARCKDADDQDASTLHPTEVRQWDCYDSSTDGYTLEDYATTTCGCSDSDVTTLPTPAPVSVTTTPSTPEPASICSTGESFQVDVLTTYEGLSLNGCYDDTGYTTSSLTRYSLDGVTIDAATGPDTPVVFAYQETSSDHLVWFVGIERQDYGTLYLRRCKDADDQDASTLHPTEVRQWDCYDSSTDDYMLEDYATTTCGCSDSDVTTLPTPAPVSVTTTPSTPEPASTCSTGESFQVDVLTTYEGLSLNGCYDDTGYTTSSLTRYSLDGVTIDAATGPDTPVVFAYQEVSSDHLVWFVGIERQDYGTLYLRRCKDADDQDASTLHPTEVRQWDCYDSSTDDYTLEDYATTTCGCSDSDVTTLPTPAPVSVTTTPSTPEPASTCSTGESFQVDVLTTYEGLSLNGCYDDIGYTASSLPTYSLDGVTIDAATGPDTPVVFAYQEVSSDHLVWFVGIERQDYGTLYLRRCKDADDQDASTLHPTEVRQWDCYDSSTDEYTLEDYATTTCGCTTFGPTAAPSGHSSAAPTPGSGAMGVTAETSALSDSSDGDSGVSAGVIVGGAIGGAFVTVALVMAFLFKTDRLKTGTRGTSSDPISDP